MPTQIPKLLVPPCPLCEREYSTWDDLASHIDDHSMEMNPDMRRFWSCPCGWWTDNSGGTPWRKLAAHLRSFKTTEALTEHLVLAAIASVGR